MPTNMVVVIAVAVLLVAVVASFFLLQSSGGISKTQAQNLFNIQCQEYGKESCTWNVTDRADFQQFVNSCKILYGQDKEALTCLYSICSQCKRFDINNYRCDYLCSGIRGQRDLGNSVDEACSTYKADAQCGTIKCGACS